MMRAAAAKRAAHRIGRRGAILALLGIISLAYGISLRSDPPLTVGLRLALHATSLTGWSTAWIAAGICAVCCAPLRRDWPGFTAIYLVSVPWSLSYLVSWWPLGENPRGWVTCLIFAAFGGVAVVTAAWPEPVRNRMRGGRDEP